MNSTTSMEIDNPDCITDLHKKDFYVRKRKRENIITSSKLDFDIDKFELNSTNDEKKNTTHFDVKYNKYLIKHYYMMIEVLNIESANFWLNNRMKEAF